MLLIIFEFCHILAGFTEKPVEVTLLFKMLPWEDSICMLTYCLKDKETETTQSQMADTTVPLR